MILDTNTSLISFGSIGRMIDRSIYSFIGSVYQLIIDLSNYQIFTDSTINNFARKIYALIGIFMLFKLTFSMVSYIVNPDQISDKARGFGSLIRNIIVSLVLVVAVPYIFSEAYYVQRRILEDGTLVKIIFDNNQSQESGEEAADKSDTSYGGFDKENLSFLLYSQFVKPNKEIDDIGANCKLFYKYDDGKKVKINGSTIGYQMDEDCEAALRTVFENSEKCDEDVFELYKVAMEYRDFTILSNADDIYKCRYKSKDIQGKNVKLYVIDYSWLTSVITGLVVLIMLISICIDVAVRTVKLAFYQMIAPIPIIANCAPGSKPDGALQKWFKACINTYLDLFIRLFGLFLGMYVITQVTDTIRFEGIATIVIIIGVLIFVKQIPKIVTDITGLKFDGFTLNPFKKIENEALGGKQLITGGKRLGTGLAAGAAAGLGSGLSNLIAPGKRGKGFGGFMSRVGSGAAGLATGFTRGMSRGLHGDKFGKSVSSSYGSTMKDKMSRADRRDAGVSWGEMMGSRVQQAMGMHSTTDSVKAAEDSIKKIQDAYKLIQGQADAMDKYNDISLRGLIGDAYKDNKYVDALRDSQFKGYKALKSFYDKEKDEQVTRLSGENDADFTRRKLEHEQYLRAIEDAMDKRINYLAQNGGTGDSATDLAIKNAYGVMESERDSFNSIIDKIDSTVGHIGGADAKSINGSSRGASARLTVSESRLHADKVQQYGAKKDQK